MSEGLLHTQNNSRGLKTFIQIQKINGFDILVALILFNSVILSGCGIVPMVNGVVPAATIEVVTESNLPPVFGPETARDTALDFVRTSFGSTAPNPELIWVGGEAPHDDLIGSSTFQYVSTGWVARISFLLTTPDATIYTVKIRGEEQGLSWEGMVDANGQVVTTMVSIATPSPTPEVIAVEPISTPTPKVYCDWLAFVKDVTIPDGTALKTGGTFIKTWRLKNQGTCTWTPDYALVFSSGVQMGDTVAVKLPGYVTPGNTVDVSVTLTAPSAPGNHRGYWMLRNASGSLFGYGDNANKAFYVDIRSVSNTYGIVSGRICYHSERIPPMTLYLPNMDKNKLTQISISENQMSYQVQLEPGSYLAYAWTLNFEMAGGYTHADHRLRTFEVEAGQSLTGIDICDWYGEPGTIPLPSPDNYGTISGRLTYPSEQIPPLRVVAFDIYNDASHWVDTIANQQTYEIKNLMPGYYTIVAYERANGLAGGYTKAAKYGLGPECPDDHELIILYVDPGLTMHDINPADWYAPAGTFPPDPTP